MQHAPCTAEVLGYRERIADYHTINARGYSDDGHQQPGYPGSTEANHAGQFEDTNTRKGKIDADQLSELLFRNPPRYRFGLEQGDGGIPATEGEEPDFRTGPEHIQQRTDHRAPSSCPRAGHRLVHASCFAVRTNLGVLTIHGKSVTVGQSAIWRRCRPLRRGPFAWRRTMLR